MHESHIVGKKPHFCPFSLSGMSISHLVQRVRKVEREIIINAKINKAKSKSSHRAQANKD